MPNLLLSLGMPTTLIQNQVYALPAQLAVITASGAVDTSMDGTTWTAFTSGGFSGAVFARSTAANVVVTCK